MSRSTVSTIAKSDRYTDHLMYMILPLQLKFLLRSVAVGKAPEKMKVMLQVTLLVLFSYRIIIDGSE